jgi:hypothetical protein
MLEFTTHPDPTAAQPERDELFSIDGKAYSIPREMRPLDMANYTYLVDTLGGDSAALWALQRALGNEGFSAFMDLPPEQISREDFTRIMQVVTGRFVGLKTEVPGADPKSLPAAPATSTEPASEPPDEELWPDAPAATDPWTADSSEDRT